MPDENDFIFSFQFIHDNADELIPGQMITTPCIRCGTPIKIWAELDGQPLEFAVFKPCRDRAWDKLENISYDSLRGVA